jgi:hypothetical protein
MLSLRPLAAAVVGMALTSLTGCVPTTWLPDSSGFIYVKPVKVAGEPSRQLLHYDLQKKASSVIVEDVGKVTMWPALSPDGKRLAVARLNGGPKEAKAIQIVVYDFQGKELHVSKAVPWTLAPQEGALPIDLSAVMLFWSPKHDMLVVTDGNVSGMYDVKQDRLNVIDKAFPLIHGGSPIRPDGEGFLLLMGEGKEQRVVFMDWQGKEHKIDADAFVAVMPNDNNPGNSPLGGLGLAGLMMPSWWDGTAAWAGFKRDKATYSVDTAKKKIDFTEGLAAMAKAKKKVGEEVPMRFDFPGDISITVTQFKEMPPGMRSFNKVVVVNHKTKQEVTLLDKGPQITMFLPSPDGNYLNLSLSDFQPGEEDLILVINQKGELVTKLGIDR